MKLNVQAINFDVSEKLEVHIEKKTKKLNRLYDEILNVEVFFLLLKPETAANKQAEIRVFVPNADFFASKINDTFEEAVDLCIEALERQISKHKEKTIKK